MAQEMTFKTTFTVDQTSSFKTDFTSNGSTAFATSFNVNEVISHKDLFGRDSPNQHPIEAITGLREELDSLSSRISATVEVAVRGELPNRGKANTIYIVTEENASYRWDEANGKYFCIGRDYEEVEIIICGGNANGI